ncbi:NAD-dependent epimerase/dehydratase family protein [Desulfovibrio sp. OttesenSCG-928-I05]|nr:NAD-dependent epimerase/dehydratase family protein [Desulfovibrio sp. OttesenSCG-928-I05]
MSTFSILLTGATGFIGKNLLPLLRERYAVTAPRRDELNLLDVDAVQCFLRKGRFDAVIHAANPTGHNSLDRPENLLENSMRVFLALERCAGDYGKMIYFGSGAEFGKHRPLAMISEDRFDEELPRDPYGISRYLMQRLTCCHNNVINFRLFGCYGPGDAAHKLIPDIMRSIREHRPIKLRQNVVFDFLYVTDIFPVIEHCLTHGMQHSDYNVCSGKPVPILEIAEEVRRQMQSDLPIEVERDAMGFSYTASNDRLLAEMPHWCPVSLQTGIQNIVRSTQNV